MNIATRVLRHIVFARLSRIQNGSLEVRHDGSRRAFGDGHIQGPSVTIHDDRFFATVVFRGHIGAADAFTRGWWSTDDLTSLIQVFLRNRDVLDGLETGWARLATPFRWAIRLVRPNSRSGSKRNIEAHYDLGNEFFAKFLDETLTYSCAYFTNQDDTLQEASVAKYDRLCQKLELDPMDHVVEIGSGWGGFALHAVRNYGCRVTTTTISPKQFTYVKTLVAREGLTDKITVLQKDYRDLTGQFDKLVSIEMIEAIGHRQFETFFQKCASLLKPTGMATVQTITIQDHLYEQARLEIDFIKKYIFPGSCIPSLGALQAASTSTDLCLIHSEDIGPHYAGTLSRWRSNFEARWSDIQTLGFDDRFRRLWIFYFCYCEGGFREGTLGNAQLLFAKSEARVTSREDQLQASSSP